MDRSRERTLRSSVVALAGLVVVAAVAGACGGESTHVTASSTPLAGVSVHTWLRLDGAALLIGYRVVNQGPSGVVAVTDTDRSYFQIGDDGVMELGRTFRPPAEGIVRDAVPRADAMVIPSGKSFREEFPLHRGQGPLETAGGPVPFADITGARFCVGLIPEHEVQPYERQGMIATVAEDKKTVSTQQIVCSDLVPLWVNADGYLAPPP